MNLRLGLVFIGLMAGGLQAEPVRDKHVTAELIAENTHAQPGQPFWLAVKLNMDPHWHTYWRNPGDSGLGTTVDWELPEGYQAGPLVWPHPENIVSGPLVSYGYENEVALLTLITPPANGSATALTIRAKAAWLMCEEVCIPGNATLALTLPVRDETPVADERWTALLASTRAQLPVSETGWTVRAQVTDKEVALILTPGTDFKRGDWTATFFPYTDDIIDHAAAQTLTAEGDGYVLRMPRSSLSKSVPEQLYGVLVRKDGWRTDGTAPAWEISATVGAPAVGTTPAIAPVAGGTPLTLLTGLLLMFVGGIILNLMPCVFPVLSLKIVNLVEQSRETHASALKHALAFTGGVLLSMWVLAAILLALRSSGSTVGWAFQMSSPSFVLGLTFLFLLIGLNMFGVFEIGLGLTRAGGGLQDKKGLAGSFFSGLLTTVAGAPCAGPFLGTAIGFALAQPTGLALLAFTAMGLGTAAPYTLLSTQPRLLKALPRPGAWMETMKQFMAFPMLVTAGWFASIYVKLHGGDDVIFRLLTAFVLVGAAAWTFGKWTALHRATGVRWAGRLATVVLLALATRYALHKSDLRVEPWSKARVEQLQKAGQPVLVDFTAEWCAICQVNKRVALEHRDVIAKLKEKGVTVLMADWTDQNAEVAAGLAEFGRAAVPLYLLYSRDTSQPPVILPQALTPGLVLEALDQLH